MMNRLIAFCIWIFAGAIVYSGLIYSWMLLSESSIHPATLSVNTPSAIAANIGYFTILFFGLSVSWPWAKGLEIISRR